MKKRFAILLVFVLVLMAGCSSPTATPSASVAPSAATVQTDGNGPVPKEVKGVTIPEFSVKVNGTALTQETMASYPVYSVQATSVNSAGTESTTTYVGFAMKDVLEAAKLTEKYVWLEAAAGDGYAVTFTGDVIYDDATLLAITKDGSQFADGPWFAPCTDKTTGNYLKGTASIQVNTTQGAPSVSAAPITTGGGATGEKNVTGEKPEILDRTDKVEFKEFSFKVNGKAVNNEALKDLKIFKITAATTNSNGESVTADYTGYKLADVLTACGVKDYKTVKAVASDGYETALTPESANSDYTLVAIEKDKELGEDGTIWLAPCLETASKSYAKLVVEIKAE